jgi:hypothetical protein
MRLSIHGLDLFQIGDEVELSNLAWIAWKTYVEIRRLESVESTISLFLWRSSFIYKDFCLSNTYDQWQ